MSVVKRCQNHWGISDIGGHGQIRSDPMPRNATSPILFSAELSEETMAERQGAERRMTPRRMDAPRLQLESLMTIKKRFSVRIMT